MPNTSVRAAAEGMPAINRRSFLTNTAAAVATAATFAVPVLAEASVVSPMERVGQLATELSEAMTVWMNDLSYEGRPDFWRAVIYPSTYPGAVGLSHIGQLDEPLIKVIEAYRKGEHEYNTTKHVDDEAADAHAASVLFPPLDALAAWEHRAVTRKGAMEALRIALKEEQAFMGSEVVQSMLAAALGYFEWEHSS